MTGQPRVLLLCLCTALAVGLGEGVEEYAKYKDPKQPVGARIKDLMGRMTLEEKVGQMTQIDRSVARPEVLRTYSIGSVLSGGGSAPLPDASAADWINMINGFQNASLSSRLGIPMIYGVDAVRGHNNVYNATIFPHNIGLGATRKVLFQVHLIGFYPTIISVFKTKSFPVFAFVWSMFLPLSSFT